MYWTLVRLQEERTRRGIAFRSNMRRFALVRLLREYVHSEAIAHAPNENEPNIGGASNAVNNNGSVHSGQIPVLVDLVSSLQDTVSALQNSVISLEQKVNNLSSSNSTVNSPQASNYTPENQTAVSSCPPPISPRVRANNNMCQQIPAASHSSNFVNLRYLLLKLVEIRRNIPLPEVPSIQSANCPEYDIISAYQPQQQSNSNFAGSQGQLSGMASANSSSRGVASLVETISPALRNAIISGRDVNLASLLIPYFNVQTDKDSKVERADPFLQHICKFSNLYLLDWGLTSL